jgi:hypothetical protein
MTDFYTMANRLALNRMFMADISRIVRHIYDSFVCHLFLSHREGLPQELSDAVVSAMSGVELHSIEMFQISYRCTGTETRILFPAN